jgi:hypothetical protein
MLTWQGGKLLTKSTSKRTINYFWGLTLRDAIIASFFGAMIALSKFLIRIPLKIPGHFGIIWMALLTVCCLQLKKGRGGTLAGFIAGTIAVFLFPGKDGILTFFKYFLPGLSLDLLLSFILPLRNRWYLTSLASLLSFALKVLIDVLSGLLLKIPINLLLLGLKISLINHLIFGFTGGALGYFIYTKFLDKELLV